MDDFEGWYEATHARVLGVCAALSGDRDSATEATGEAFARALDRWVRVAAMDSPTAWVQTVALNCLRRAMRRRRREELLWRRRPMGLAETPLPNPQLWAAVRALPQRQRLALVLRYVADLPEAEIARIMGVTRGTVAASVAAARGRLGSVLGEDADNTLEVAHHD